LLCLFYKPLPSLYKLPANFLKANAKGFYDMLGNVAEWCLDAKDPAGCLVPYAKRGSTNAHKNKEIQRLLKGGSFNEKAAACTPEGRQYKKSGGYYRKTPGDSKDAPVTNTFDWVNGDDKKFIGFRIVVGKDIWR